MGYYYHHDQTEILVKAENMQAAQDALVAWNNTLQYPTTIHDNGASPFEQLAGDGRWYCRFDKEGNLTDLSFDEIKGSDNADFLSVIAPFVESGGYVQCHNDDGISYRYAFRNGKVYHIHPTWEIPPDAEPF